MIAITESPKFIRAYKKNIKNNPKLRDRYREKVGLFIKNPFDSSLQTHKLSGILKNSWAFSITSDLRIVFSFLNADVVLFEDFGTHNEVY
jgi:mRNA-degrading endonuclease YafQ of YafQ-DinJ toxin-antitoxin module